MASAVERADDDRVAGIDRQNRRKLTGKNLGERVGRGAETMNDHNVLPANKSARRAADRSGVRTTVDRAGMVCQRAS
jgi:hypothetical protein